MPASSEGPRWPRQPDAAAPHGTTAHLRRFRPTVELLEDRSVPAVTVADLTQTTPLALVQALVGNNPIANVKYVGSKLAAGLVTGGTQAFGFDSGVVLSTGHANAIPGPNVNPFLSNINGTAGDPALSNLIKGTPTFDASELSFDFTALGNALHFQYVFGSDEYPTFVGVGFSDVFAFFLNGQNIAFLPGTQTPVDIDTVNANVNPQFFVNNPVGSNNRDTEMNGLTTVLPISVPVNPGQTYHLEFAIADATDKLGDSNVIIEAAGGKILTTAPIQAVRPLRYDYDPATGIYSGDILVTNPSSNPINAPAYVTVANLPPGVTVVNTVAVTVSGFTSNSTTHVIPIPGGSIPANSTVMVPIELRDPLQQPLGSFYIGYDIGVVQG